MSLHLMALSWRLAAPAVTLYSGQIARPVPAVPRRAFRRSMATQASGVESDSLNRTYTPCMWFPCRDMPRWLGATPAGREVVSTENAPAAVGPYSQAIKANGMVYISGQVPLVPGVSARPLLSPPYLPLLLVVKQALFSA
jgi:hypothetical protein